MEKTAYKKREEIIIDKIVSLIRKDIGPDRMLLFGSRAEGRHGPGSDFDIALDGKKISVRKMRELREKLEEVSGLHKVDIIFLESVDKEFKDIILRKGKILYERCA
ncbi:MAG: nucleotidyltransferase domain-containing protein [Candidatus Humimicrobiaceae bacterium]